MLMEAVIERGKSAAGIRLGQDAFNTASLSLYSSLGFDVKEPLCLKSQACLLDTVSTTCGSGWVRSLYACVENQSPLASTHPLPQVVPTVSNRNPGFAAKLVQRQRNAVRASNSSCRQDVESISLDARAWFAPGADGRRVEGRSARRRDCPRHRRAGL